MIRFKLSDGQGFKKIIDTFKDITESVNITCSPDGISIQALDSIHVVIASFTMHKNGFEEYEGNWTNDSPILIGINLPSLTKTLKLLPPGAAIIFNSDDNSSTLSMQFINQDDTSCDIVCNHRKVNLNVQLYTLEAAEDSSTLTIKSQDYSKMIKDLSILSETVSFEMSPDTLTTHAESIAESVTTKLRTNPDAGTKIECVETTSLTVSVKHLLPSLKVAGLATDVVIKMAPNQPLCIQFDFQTCGRLLYCVAPKVD